MKLTVATHDSAVEQLATSAPVVLSKTSRERPVPVRLWFAVAVSLPVSPEDSRSSSRVNVTDHACGSTVTSFEAATAPGGGGVSANGAT